MLLDPCPIEADNAEGEGACVNPSGVLCPFLNSTDAGLDSGLGSGLDSGLCRMPNCAAVCGLHVRGDPPPCPLTSVSMIFIELEKKKTWGSSLIPHALSEIRVATKCPEIYVGTAMDEGIGRYAIFCTCDIILDDRDKEVRGFAAAELTQAQNLNP